MIVEEDLAPTVPLSAAEPDICTTPPVANSGCDDPAKTPPPSSPDVPIVAEEEADLAPESCTVRRRRAEVSALVLRGCISQDEGAFAEFLLCYQNLVFSILSRRLGCGSHVEDLAQEIFTKAYMAFPNFELREDALPSTWLATIARRVAIDEMRKRGITTVATSDPEPGYAPAMSERAVALRLALSELPERQCEAFLLHELEGMSLREAGTMLQVAPNTVRALVDEAIGALRRRLSRRGITG